MRTRDALFVGCCIVGICLGVVVGLWQPIRSWVRG